MARVIACSGTTKKETNNKYIVHIVVYDEELFDDTEFE